MTRRYFRGNRIKRQRIRYPTMAYRLGSFTLPQTFPILAGVSIPCTLSIFSLSTKLHKWRAPPRRLFLGIGTSFFAQFINMASGSGEKSFLASARQKGVIEEVFKDVEWPEQFPFKEEDFQRFDEYSLNFVMRFSIAFFILSPDTVFYESPRFVTHIDDPAIAALTKYYSKVFPPSNTPGVSLLDLCSSWVSHFPKGYKQDRVVGMGMNEEELKRNPVLTEYTVQDLNKNPKIPFDDNSFDVITNVVSVDYLTKPIDVFKEMNRILKPGGLAIMSFSNRCFWTKAISIWTSTNDADHAFIVGSYFHYAGGFEPPQAVDISPNPGRSDPMYIVYSRKVNTA
ncbi:hypothetical protein IFM89_014804 [Coptis chinensis]|uniref:Methyltransferase type 11 domain-containing protein n=1 Tax=Coptis chinensis TaxID=261450 RepID=A0A835M4V5_9MAGN|nr:hypothetical protein IFM89_014804 [Coptis chinensis]